ncbi:oligosaccharide flippase family protein [Acidicapsa ligni]|uniref:oligosaccharide flippase family protein n=1 Tax=Acidicapsa ligni TaxID=542300 RepID=UPI0021DFC701|nr:oligosaccharide flippase family protein [Acidicapsa ligni]
MTLDTQIDELTTDDQEAVHHRSLESRALKGTYFIVIYYGFALGLRMLSSVVLTHLFAPELFGLITLTTTVIIGLNLFSHLGLEDSIIQNPRGDDEVFVNTAWTVQVLRGLGLWLLTIVLAWPVAHFYNEPRMLWLLPILGLSCVITGFGSPAQLQLSRNMDVAKMSVLELAPQLLSFLIALAWAMHHASIWALLVGRIVSETLRLAMSYKILGKGIRPRFVLDKDSLHSLMNFGRWILIGTALTFMASQSDKMILGKLTTLQELGIYGIAFSLSDLPRQIIQMFSAKVGFPFIAKFSHHPRPEFRRVLVKYRAMVLAVGAVMLTITICTGDIFIQHVYDKRYHDAAWMIGIFAIGLWHTLLYNTITPAIMSLQKAHYNALGNLFYCIALFVLLPLGYSYLGLGMIGAVVAVAVSDLPVYFVNVYASYRQGLGVLRQDGLMTLFFLATLVAGLAIRHAFGLALPFPSWPR